MLTYQDYDQKMGAGLNAGESSVKSFKSMLGLKKLQQNEKYQTQDNFQMAVLNSQRAPMKGDSMVRIGNSS